MDISYKRLLLIITVLVYSYTLEAQEIISKKIGKAYVMLPEGTLYLENKYGDVTINGWDKNKISIVVEIKVNHKKKENATNLLNRIEPKFTIIGDDIKITSEILEKSSGFFSKYFNKVNPFDFDKSNIQINYTINLPTNAAINITTKFGDLIVENWKGKLKANLQHGDIWINNDIENASIEMKFGKLKAMSISNGNFIFKNGEVDIEKSKNLKIKSSGTTIKIDEIESLDIYSNKDEVNIKSISSLKGSLKFTKMDLSNLKEKIKLYLKVAELNITKIEKNNAFVDIRQESSELNINISNLSFKLDATLTEGLLRIPKSFKNINTKMINKREKIRKIEASYGNNNNPQGRFSIIGSKGKIILYEQKN